MGKAIGKILSKKGVRVFAVDLDKKDLSGIKKSDFIILSVKPQDAPEAIKQLKKYGINKKTILLSIMAGFSLKKLLKLSGHKKIIRMMPNLGLSVGAGIAAWKKTGLPGMESKKAKKFIDQITENFEVKDEDAINKVTALSGSGPAYFFLLANSLMQAAKDLGFSEIQSRKLVEQTFSASAILGKDSEYSALINRIASRGGTTEAALKVFKKKNFDKIVKGAVGAAYKRAKELGK